MVHKNATSKLVRETNVICQLHFASITMLLVNKEKIKAELLFPELFHSLLSLDDE